MRRNSGSFLGSLVLAAVVLAVGAPPGPSAAAASLVLGNHERETAIRAGRRSVVADDFEAEWRVRDGAGQSALVMTPFHRLVLEARKSAFKKQALKPRDVESTLRETSGKLAFWVVLKGARPDFARHLAPVLRRDGRTEIEASFVQNERTALREDDGRFAARCLYVFPTEGISGTSRLLLVVRDPDDKEMAKFTVDLSGMR